MNKDVQKIFGTALFGIVNDVAKAKEEGKQLPGILDDLGTLALKAKKEGTNFAKEEAKARLLKYAPWVGLGIAVVVIAVMYSKK